MILFLLLLKNQQGYVNLLIELSPKLLESSIRYGNQISAWSNKVESRYKDFYAIMSNIQHKFGVLTSTSSTNCLLNDDNLNDTNNKQQDLLKQNEQKQKLIKKRQNIISEIITTEKTYVQDLQTCLDVRILKRCL